MSPHGALTLASSVAGAMIVALDGTVLIVAQPTLQRDLGASFAQSSGRAPAISSQWQACWSSPDGSATGTGINGFSP